MPRLWRADFSPKVVLQSVLMESAPKPALPPQQPAAALYCPVCATEVTDPLTCSDCSSVICRRCGTPLESSDELAMG